MLLGILYCQEKPLKRVEKFYDLLQVNLDDFICHNDSDFETYFPLMAKISYQLMICMYNDYQMKGDAHEMVRHDWLPRETPAMTPNPFNNTLESYRSN